MQKGASPKAPRKNNLKPPNVPDRGTWIGRGAAVRRIVVPRSAPHIHAIAFVPIVNFERFETAAP